MDGSRQIWRMPLSYDLCQRPFQCVYLLQMHSTYFHKQPPLPPLGPDDFGPAAEKDNSTTERTTEKKREK